MRKNLPTVPLLVSLGHIPGILAEELVESGSAISLRGKAALLLSCDGIVQLLEERDASPKIVDLVRRGVEILKARRAAEPRPDQNSNAEHA